MELAEEGVYLLQPELLASQIANIQAHRFLQTFSATTHLPISLPIPAAAQILFRVHHNPFLLPHHVFKHWIAGRERDAVVTTLHDQVDLIQEGAHLGEAGGMVAEVVGARKGVESGEDGARDEGRRHCKACYGPLDGDIVGEYALRSKCARSEVSSL